ncbi:hypothetical protein E8E11_000870 [Didymella keratinophila]|nr:hypothetical protein E8E11_000870 [Didymella keratinophila]
MTAAPGFVPPMYINDVGTFQDAGPLENDPLLWALAEPTAARPTPTPTLSAHVCTLAIMKRCLSDGHDCNVSHSSAPGTRRRRTQRADPTGARAATEQDDIQHWLHSSDATPEWPATMAAPPTPRSASRTSAGRHQQRLVNHQASGSILTDTHAADMGVRFRFLAVEAKGQSLNGSLISAQNQAAISGASMLRILRDLDEATHSSPPSPPLCFSTVT